MNDFAVQADEEADPARHFSAHHLHAVSVNNFAVGISQQAEIQIVISDELFVALGGIETDSDDLDIVLLQANQAVTETARFLRAARGVVFRVKIEQDDFFADEAVQLKRLAVLILAGEQRRLVAGFGNGGKSCRGGKEDGTDDEQAGKIICFHNKTFLFVLRPRSSVWRP